MIPVRAETNSDFWHSLCSWVGSLTFGDGGQAQAQLDPAAANLPVDCNLHRRRVNWSIDHLPFLYGKDGALGQR